VKCYIYYNIRFYFFLERKNEVADWWISNASNDKLSTQVPKWIRWLMTCTRGMLFSSGAKDRYTAKNILKQVSILQFLHRNKQWSHIFVKFVQTGKVANSFSPGWGLKTYSTWLCHVVILWQWTGSISALNRKSIPFSPNPYFLLSHQVLCPRTEIGPADHEGLRKKGDNVKGSSQKWINNFTRQ